MPVRDPRIDAYIAKAAPFARPILRHLRATVRAACPAVQETMKWGFPHFEHHGLLASMAAFKAHAVFGFWKGALIIGPKQKSLEAMGSFGRLTSVDDLPPRSVLARYVRRAAVLNESGTKVVRPLKRRAAASRRVPADLATGLRAGKNAKARAFFESLAPSQRAEYIEWITAAKRPETRTQRLATALEWLGQGKKRHWKYEK